MPVIKLFLEGEESYDRGRGFRPLAILCQKKKVNKYPKGMFLLVAIRNKPSLQNMKTNKENGKI